MVSTKGLALGIFSLIKIRNDLKLFQTVLPTEFCKLAARFLQGGTWPQGFHVGGSLQHSGPAPQFKQHCFLDGNTELIFQYLVGKTLAVLVTCFRVLKITQ